MKKYLSIVLVFIIMLSGLTGCNKKEEKKKEQLNLNRIQEISELATLETYYHNVAKINKKAGSGLLNIGEVNRKYWIEYNGVAKIGIKADNITFEINGNNIVVTMPHAIILDTKIENYNQDSVYKTKDSWFNANEITKSEINKAIKETNDVMINKIKNESNLFTKAEHNAEALLTSYINEIGKIHGEKYEIKYVYK